VEFSLFERLHQPFLLWWGTPEQDFLDRLLREDLIRAIEALPERFRIVVVLADVQGLSYLEIAGSLEVPIGTVRSRLARGRALLQKALWDHACDAGLRA
jgi:RNA polymerase sigma-70 factor (ECF subfamily)